MKFSEVETGDIVRISKVVTVDDLSGNGGFFSGESWFTPTGNWELELIDRPDKNWPPQVGDVWEAGGNDYVVERCPYGTGAIPIELIRPVDMTIGFHSYSDYERDGRKVYVRTYDNFKALKPVLVRRR